MHVGDQHGGAVLDEVAHEVPADLADAGHADGAAAERRLAPGGLRGGAHALEDAVRREHRAVAGAAVGGGAAGDVGALAGDVVHVVGEGADVAGGVVAAVERLDEAAVGTQQALGLQRGRVADDHGLAAAEVEAGQRRLVGHAAREVEDVADGVVGGGVGVEAGAAQCRAQRRGVDRHDRPETGGGVVGEDDLLVLGAQLEDVDGRRGSGRAGGGGAAGGGVGGGRLRHGSCPSLSCGATVVVWLGSGRRGGAALVPA